jgi:membrane-associated phospholipid phosphatase
MNIINFLQTLQFDALTAFFKFITFFGDKEFYIMVLPLFFWLWKKEKALKLMLILLPSLLLNFYLKEIFHTPRPTGVALIEATGFAFPSGHAQGSTTLWLMLALLVRQRWMSILSATMIILVSLSRLYLGVHFPLDILGGFLVGVFLVFIYHKYLFDALKHVLSEKTKLGKATVLTILVLFFTIAYPVDDAITILSVIWGFGLILIFTKVLEAKTPNGFFWKLLLLIIGIVGVLLIWKGLKFVLPTNELGRFIRYALIGIWTGLIPIFFRKR